MTPADPLVDAGSQKHLEVSVRKDNDAHITAVGHQAGCPAKVPLPLHQGAADSRQGSNAGRTVSSRLGANGIGDIGPVQQDPDLVASALEPGIKARGQLGKSLTGIQLHPTRNGIQGNEAVQGTTVQQMPAELLGHEAAYRTLTGPARAVDGQDRCQRGGRYITQGQPP